MRRLVALIAAGSMLSAIAVAGSGGSEAVQAATVSGNGLITWSGVWARDLEATEGDIVSLANGSNPAWSADGTELAYDRVWPAGIGGESTIFFTDRFGCAESLVVPGSEPSWSPDGSRLAFHRSVGGNTDIYTVNRDGSGLERLTDHPDGDYSAAWSPDGSKIAFTSFRNGIGEIYVMQADGSHETRLTYSPDSSSNPDWSPDGTKIAYSSITYRPSLFESNVDIMVIASSGGSPTRISTDPIDDPHPVQDWRPAWSPDGTMIAFQSDLYDIFPCPGWPGLPWHCRASRIWVMDADGSNLRLISHEGGIQGIAPDWQHDSGSAGPLVRVAGADRFATAVEVSKRGYPSGASVAFVAVADNFPDALVGGPLAAQWDGPILLSLSDVLPGSTAAELARLGPDEIVVLGGTGVISDAVANQTACHALP